ncbi:MAG: DEAD/DEAH box helicase [Candidatus Rokubacteria bacterium]|nr:DEAD/DEAH box helicase [Candidatus Rokubacteria bacterium]
MSTHAAKKAGGSDGALALDVFSLRDSVVEEYKRFATSFTTIYAQDIRDQVEAIYAEQRYWPEPLIQINPSYKRTADVSALVNSGVLDPGCADIFQADGRPLSLYKHQEQAIALATEGESFVVTTGTGSGKSLCFFIPIVSHVLSARRSSAQRRTRAIVVYPMNALANSQMEELGKFVGNVPGRPPITFARYTGQEDADERKRVAEEPPDILLTNFMMLELLMTRQEGIDRRVIGNCAGLRFLVLDEFHTYRGRQGADVALLVRRVRERLQPEKLLCIGTSATMASEGSVEDKSRVVARVASKLFANSIGESNVIVETLERITDSAATAESVRPLLGKAIDAGVPQDIPDAALREHPLAVWVETRLGISFSQVDQRWVRAKPMTETEAVMTLSAEAGRDAPACRRALRDLLLVSSVPEQLRTSVPGASEKSFFAFKLHQFISGAGHAYATMEPDGTRKVTVEGQQFFPEQPDKRLYALHFCRECGHEYHPVRLVKEEGAPILLARDIDDAPPAKSDETDGQDEQPEGETFGFLTPHPSHDTGFTFDDRDEDYPETWLEFDTSGNPRLKPSYRGARARRFTVAPDGRIGSGTKAWFLPGKFRLCLRCGGTQGGAARDRTRLASLSAEGRSSATTVLVSSVLHWMHGAQSGMALYTRKLLGFSDNRQDAALQAGHFNDFLFVSLIRAGFLGALQDAGSRGLRSDELGAAQQSTLGFNRPDPQIRAEWLLEASLRGFNLQEAEGTLRQVLAYRVWFDQRRGWRYTNPNLEQLGLVRVEYLGLAELAADDELFAGSHPVLKQSRPEVRTGVYRELLDHLRKWLAIRSQVLDAAVLEQLVAKSHSRIRPPWGFGMDESPRGARWLMIVPPTRRASTLRDMDLIVRGGSRSGLGKTLRSANLWGGDTSIRDVKSKDFDQLVSDLLRAAAIHGLVSEESTPFDQPGWRLNDACVVFRLGDPSTDASASTQNVFFRDLYGNLATMLRAPMHPLFGFEAREHTAQVDPDNREIREKRFRFGDRERQELALEEKRLRDIGEANRFLPVLFCSPTMELGVDISALNAVHMRNVPPTPANYAQRSGRAGRSGQAALVITYASSQSPHDQYFFRDPKAMVHGEVRAPLLELANRDLIESHLQAIWLSCVDQPLDPCIAELLVLNDTIRPLKPEIIASMKERRVAELASERIKRVLDLVADDLTSELAPWYTGRADYADAIVVSALERFDKAFDRWRDLFAAAEEQRDAARRTMDDYSAPYQEKRAAQSRHAQAIDQLNLLQRGTNALSSDFYTYRYLATEGFLPGYNFPRLPLLAYIPATRDGRGRQTYLQRPRFLALAEFGPRSLVYHEGRAYRVVRALLSLGHRESATPDAQLPTKAVRICSNCGAGHFGDDLSMCRACGTSLGTAEVVNHVYRIENVATQPAERITANDEERTRQGFDLQTTFEWAIRDQEIDVRRASACDEEGEIVRMAYGAGATITRLNKGLRRRADKKVLGFRIDPVSGYWAKNRDEDEGDGGIDPTASPRQWIVPSVQDRKNALLFRPVGDAFSEVTLATVQHALLRGIEAVFQLEEGEMLAEPMPTRDVRNGFLLYEATEGGAGVLTRLVSEKSSLATVARKALQVMHLAVGDGPLPAARSALVDQPGTACVAACYRCLMSYYNQPDHEILDRRDEATREILLRLSSAETACLGLPPLQVSVPVNGADAGEDRWLAEATRRGIPAPDPDPLIFGERRLNLVWRRHYVAAVVDEADRPGLQAIENLGFDVILFEDPATWNGAFARLATALGRVP